MDRKGVSLVISEKSRNKTETMPAKTEHGQNRDKKRKLCRKKKNRDKSSNDSTGKIRNN